MKKPIVRLADYDEFRATVRGMFLFFGGDSVFLGEYYQRIKKIHEAMTQEFGLPAPLFPAQVNLAHSYGNLAIEQTAMSLIESTRKWFVENYKFENH